MLHGYTGPMTRPHAELDSQTVKNLEAIANFTDTILEFPDRSQYVISDEAAELATEITVPEGPLSIEISGENDAELTFTGLRLAIGKNTDSNPAYHGSIVELDEEGAEILGTQRSLVYRFRRKPTEYDKLLSASATDERQEKRSESVTNATRLASVILEISQVVEVADQTVNE